MFGKEMEAMRVDVIEKHREYDGVFKLDRAVLRYERFDGQMGGEATRLVFERGDSVAVVLYNRERDSVILVEQFRYPAYVREEGNGWLMEIVAGMMDRDRPPDVVAREELIEEAGYAVEMLESVTTFYPSPGACSERIHLYLGHVSTPDSVGAGGGRPEEGEDIRVRELPLDEALHLVREGAIRDAKTIIALQYLALRQAGCEVEPT
jgi:ADP-ribose pyrophosphatase